MSAVSGLEGIKERADDGGTIGRMSPGVRAGIEAFPMDWVGVFVVFSIFAELGKTGGFAGFDVSDCVESLGVSGAIAGLNELGGVAEAADLGDNAGCEELRCGIAAGDFTSLLVGRVGKTGGRVVVLGRIGLPPDLWDEGTYLLAG